MYDPITENCRAYACWTNKQNLLAHVQGKPVFMFWSCLPEALCQSYRFIPGNL